MISLFQPRHSSFVGALTAALGLALSACAVFAGQEDIFSEEDRRWWAIQPVTNPESPADFGNGWARNDIDRFVARQHDANGLTPAGEADKRELARRAYFDLHGLPPTPEQTAAFVADSRLDAWERLIEELLASPRYGERWGQHWLDVVRWAESDGYNQDAFRPDAWPYRDYVIKSINDDKPYDQFVREQLAGDEIDPDNPEVLIGTAFLRNGIYEYNQRNVRMHWELIVNELTALTGDVFLGLGIGCAQCHDHKFDPILHEDYYRLQAFLAPVRWRFDLPLATADERKRHAAKLAEWEAATAEIRAGIDAILEPKIESKQHDALIKFPEDIQAMFAKPKNDRTPYEQQLVELSEIQIRYERERFDEKAIQGEEKKELERLRAELAKFDSIKPKPLPAAFVATDIRRDAPKVLLKKRDGETEIPPGFLTLLDPDAPEIVPTGASSGRRLALANWMTRPDNPLSTRVIVNRVWQYHFGRGIVATPNDFGTLGEEPSHPELLDWLTKRFLEDGWRMKPLHRLIMQSATYRQTTCREPSAKENITDPGNRFLWRFPPRRLDAEEIRDAMLVASGEIDLKAGGPSVDGETPRRSVYVKKSRNRPDELIAGFDAPLGFESAPSRTTTTTPTQSLLLVNGDWPTDRARALAKRVLAGKTEIDSASLGQAIEAVYGRETGKGEIDRALAFVRAQSESASTAAEIPDDGFPDETGLRPVTQAFRSAEGVTEFGTNALWLQPGSRFEKLHLEEIAMGEDAFTVEAIAVLDNLHRDASVNTLASRWNGDQKSPGWTFGVTSEKSKYEPRNLIVQLIGRDFQDVTVYEVVASGLRFPLAKPVYIAAVIAAAPSPDDETTGSVTFYMKDLSDPVSPLQKRVVKHAVVRDIQTPVTKFLVGGRDEKGHLWDGQLARLAVSRGSLDPQQLFISAHSGEADRILDWTFSGEDGEEPAPGTSWVRAPASAEDGGGVPPRLLAAMTDFCHALLISNEFLYLH